MNKQLLSKYFWWTMVDLAIALVLTAELAAACLTDMLGLEIFVIPSTLFALALIVPIGRQHWGQLKEQQG